MQLVLNLHIPLHLFFIQLYFMAKPHLIYELNVPICDEHYYAKHRKKIYSPRGADVQFLLNIPTVRILPA